MEDLEKINKIEIRSEEVQDVLGASPRWIVRAGISVILLVVVSLLIGSWFFRYPDIIQSEITITTQNPPASIQAMNSGKITDILVKESDKVQKQQIIAIIENTANFQDVILLEIQLRNFVNIQDFQDTNQYSLGEIQPYYSSFQRLLKDYKSFLELDYYNNKIESTEKQIKDFKIYYNRLWEQRNMKEQELKIAEMQFERDKKLFEKNVYSKSDYEKAEKTYLQEKLSFENIRSTLANTQMQINQLDQQILDLQLQKSKEEQSQVIALEESAQNLNTQIKQWKLRYLIIAPISGNVTFTKIWSENQNVQTGEIVATIIPNEATNIIGKVAIPSAGVGKVKEGQTVNIKLNNFPYMEFGILKGTIRNISLVPIQSENGAIYTAEVELSDSLISNYGKQLKFSQQMTGTAEIITDDLRLLERFFNPLKAIWKKNVE